MWFEGAEQMMDDSISRPTVADRVRSAATDRPIARRGVHMSPRPCVALMYSAEHFLVVNEEMLRVSKLVHALQCAYQLRIAQ